MRIKGDDDDDDDGDDNDNDDDDDCVPWDVRTVTNMWWKSSWSNGHIDIADSKIYLNYWFDIICTAYILNDTVSFRYCL